MTLASFSLLSFSFGVVLVAILVLLKRRDRIGLHFLIFSVAVSGWGFPHTFWLSERYDYGTSMALSRTAHAFANFIPIAWFHFVMRFIGKREPVKHFYRANYLLAAFLAATAPFPIFIKGMKPISGVPHFTDPGFFFHWFTVIFFTFVSVGFYHLILAYRASYGQEKYQLKYLVLGTLIGFVCGSSLFLPTYGIPFPLYLLPGMMFYPVFMGIALIRHGLFDVQQIANAFQREKLAAIGTLTTSINHEIRNPLYIIQGLAESHLESVKEGRYLNKEQALDKSNEILAKTAEQSARAMEIMKRFAMFAKQNVSQEAQLEKVNLRETMEGILPLVRHELELDKIELAQQIPENLPPLQADRRQLEEIFFNLIVNACQAMKEMGGRIEIGAEQRNGVMKITIEDNGPGIPSDRLAKIFEPFYTTKDEGTGLGLYIVKQLVERNGGKISVKSQPGKGTTFLLEFRL